MRTNRRAILAAYGIVLAIQIAVIADRRAKHPSDFDIAREFGRRFLAGEYLYRGGLHFPYLPAAAMAYSPLALMPAHLAFAVRYATALALLALTLSLLRRLLPRPLAPDEGLVVGSIAVGLALQYVLRDLGDAGPHLILLALTIGGIFLARRGRERTAALLFGLAIAVKTPLAILLPFFAWKRRWSLVFWTALATSLWIAAPAVRMGAGDWWAHQRAWAEASLPFLTAAAAPSVSAGGPPVAVQAVEEWPNNQSLRAVLARNLPDGPTSSNAAAALLTGAVVVAAAWWMRRPWGTGESAWLPESSAVLILAALLSPIAWRQHLVFALPALYSIAAAQRSPGGLGPFATAAMALYAVLALVLNREVLGHDLSYRLNGYGLHTAAMLLVLGVLVTRPR